MARKIQLLCLLALGLFSLGKIEGGEFYGAVEALYWKPAHTPILAGRQIGPDGGGIRPRKNLLIYGEFDWGVRVQGGYAFCCNFVDLSYLYYDSSTNSNFSAAPGSVIRFPSGAATDNLTNLKSKLDWRYQNVDFRFGRCLLEGCCWELFSYLNGRWVEVKLHNLDTGYRSGSAVADTFLQKSKFQGGGLGLGICSIYTLFDSLKIKGSFGAMGIYGEQNHSISRFFETDIPNSTLILKENPRNYLLPAIEFRLGAAYPFCLGCFHFAVEAGYELDYYFNITKHNVAIDRNAEDDVVHLNYYDAGFGGPYFRLSATF